MKFWILKNPKLVFQSFFLKFNTQIIFYSSIIEVWGFCYWNIKLSSSRNINDTEKKTIFLIHRKKRKNCQLFFHHQIRKNSIKNFPHAAAKHISPSIMVLEQCKVESAKQTSKKKCFSKHTSPTQRFNLMGRRT